MDFTVTSSRCRDAAVHGGSMVETRREEGGVHREDETATNAHLGRWRLKTCNSRA